MFAAATHSIIEYEYVTVNTLGVIQERHRGRAQQSLEMLAPGVFLEMIHLPGGTFLMGSPKGEGYDDERPQHQVTLLPFTMSKTLITQAQWQTIVSTLPPCRFAGATHPVHNITWHEAMSFCAALSEHTGHLYTLPSEAQWEYACRAHTTTPFYTGETITSDLANYKGEFVFYHEPSGKNYGQTTSVGQFPANAFGLTDMHGNLWEWCADVWHNTYRHAPRDGTAWSQGRMSAHHVGRGGSWHDLPHTCRSATRLKLRANEGDETIGFRVVSSLASSMK
jgi:formylglycine-generating enzyme required for sulfatase activity